jgi:hypothetical protein
LTLAGLLAASCGSPTLDRDDPGSVALSLFELSHRELHQAELEALFEHEALAEQSVSLRDALGRLPPSAEPRLLRTDPSPDGQEVYADLALELPGGGQAAYTVELRAAVDGGWRIAWFQGPGVEWPPSGGSDPGLTTSAPPHPRPGRW